MTKKNKQTYLTKNANCQFPNLFIGQFKNDQAYGSIPFVGMVKFLHTTGCAPSQPLPPPPPPTSSPSINSGSTAGLSMLTLGTTVELCNSSLVYLGCISWWFITHLSCADCVNITSTMVVCKTVLRNIVIAMYCKYTCWLHVDQTWTLLAIYEICDLEVLPS